MKQWFLKTRNDPISGETCLKHRHCKSHHFGSGVLGRFLLSLRDRIIWTVPPELVPMPRLDTWWAWRSSEQTGDRTNCFDILEFFFHRFGFGSDFISRHISEFVIAWASAHAIRFYGRISSFFWVRCSILLSGVQKQKQRRWHKTMILKNKKKLSTSACGEAKIGRKLPKTLCIDHNSVSYVRSLAASSLGFARWRVKPRLRVPQVLSVLIPFAWRVKRPGCRGKRLNFTDRRLTFCLRTSVMCRFVREVLPYFRNGVW